jgi:hypothetical protein
MTSARRGCGTHFGHDTGSIVVGWLTKLVVALALVGVMAFDALSVGAAHVSASDDANQAAAAAQSDWLNSHDVQSAYNAAAESLTNSSEQVLTRGFSIEPDGSVHLLLQRTATTLVLNRIGPLRKYTVFTTAGEATAPTS